VRAGKPDNLQPINRNNPEYPVEESKLVSSFESVASSWISITDIPKGLTKSHK
jgi:hypothetical protein